MSGKQLSKHFFIFTLLSIFITFCTKEEPVDISECDDTEVGSPSQTKPKSNETSGGGASHNKQVEIDCRNESLSGSGVSGLLSAKGTSVQSKVKNRMRAGGSRSIGRVGIATQTNQSFYQKCLTAHGIKNTN